ncbi:CBS domain-containing protein [bacterium]|nr:MAG: CBS domain-containing protein [bacterium]
MRRARCSISEVWGSEIIVTTPAPNRVPVSVAKKRDSAPGSAYTQGMDRFRRFVDAYNDIDEFLRERLGEGDGVGFGTLLRAYSERYRLPPHDVELIRLLSGLRNELIHSTSFMEPLIEPSEHALSEIERLRDGLLRPVRAIDRHRKAVVTLALEDTIQTVLRAAAEEGFNVFPVYDDGRYEGLVTADGIVRLLARMGGKGIENRPISEVLALDPKRLTGRIVAGGVALHEVEAMFADDVRLQAVVLTPNGRETERPVGILTAADASRASL